MEFISFSSFSLVVLHFGYRYRQNKETIPEPKYRIPIVDRIMIALYINMAGQFVSTCNDVTDNRFAQFLDSKNSFNSSWEILSSLKFTFTFLTLFRFSRALRRSALFFLGNLIMLKRWVMSLQNLNGVSCYLLFGLSRCVSGNARRIKWRNRRN